MGLQKVKSAQRYRQMRTMLQEMALKLKAHQMNSMNENAKKKNK